MKRAVFVPALLLCRLAVWAAAAEESTAVAPIAPNPPAAHHDVTTTPGSNIFASTTTPTEVKKSTPSVATMGETVKLPAPKAMTDHDDYVVAWTRRAEPLRDAAPRVSVVRPQEFLTFQAQTAGEALLHEASVDVPSTGGIVSALRARLRGASARDTLVLVDGRPVQGFAFGAADLSEISPEQIDHIEVVRGGMSALYGPNASAGVINVITKRAIYEGYTISHLGYEGGSYGRQLTRLDFGSRWGKFDFFFFGSELWESGFRSNSDARQHNIGGNIGVTMGRAGRLSVDVAAFRRNGGTPGAACGPADPLCQAGAPVYLTPSQFNNVEEKISSTPSRRQSTDSGHVRASYQVRLSSAALLSVRAFNTDRRVEVRDGSLPALSTDLRQQSKGGEVQLDGPWGFTGGGAFLHDRQTSEDRLVSTSPVVNHGENYGFFAQERLQWRPVTVIASCRFDHSGIYGDSLNPRAETLLGVGGGVRLSASIARAMRAPTFDELDGAPAGRLKAEKSWTYETGFDWHSGSQTLRTTFFRANVGDLLQTDALSGSTRNVGEARRQGVEVEWQPAPRGFYRERWNYTYLDNRGRSGSSNDRVWLAYSPRHTANYVGTYTLGKRWSIDNTVRFVSARYTADAGTGTRLSPLLLWDLRALYRWRQMDVFIGVRNITNRRYEDVEGFPLPGRTAYGGIRLRLWG